MSNKFSSTIQAYDTYASQFADNYEKKIDPSKMDDFASHLPSGVSILDAGCGSGRDAAYFVSKGFDVLGIDISEGFLAEVKKRHPEVHTELMSLTDITFEDETFDGVWCRAAILHLDRADVPKVLNDFYRVLKPGGMLFLQTKAGEGQKEQTVILETKITRLFTLFTNEEILKMLDEAGFEIVKNHGYVGQLIGKEYQEQEWIVILARKK